ncbi:ROK family transcriptional regulator [Phytomonospora endophytica]|uniref:Putative NBD/HSP70 family sugar kinase n=1 Tax=Phytomonospora endophytica TaxID=714109 RepID=A0A841FIR2_9ACTN|nr:ROK family protein [Phytomonospora endophytica]MBB6035764.1 putative NBD/HSP70 family sugar kinase [Phytomonospora endophytica]
MPGPGGGDLARLRQLNERTVLRVVREAGRPRVAEIVAASGLGRTVVEEVLQSLAGRGWLVEEPAAVTGRGRPARAWRFRAEAGHVAGLDIGAHGVRAVVADLSGHVLATVHERTTPALTRQKRLRTAGAALDTCLSEAGAPAPWALGVGTTGQVDATGRVTHCNAIPGWTGLDLAAHFRAATAPALVVVDNDSQLAALAEHRRGAAVGVGDLVLMQAGLRTGMAMILDGRLRRGSHGAAGDLSLLRGVAWEAAIEHLHRCPDVPADVPGVDRAERAFAEARAGRPRARTAVRRYVRAMAVAAATAVSVVDPALLVVGGAFSRSADLICEPLAEELSRLCSSVPEIRASTLGAECAALGGVALALDGIDRRLLADSRGRLPDLGVNSL